MALSGGVGGARLLRGLARALPPGALTAVVNTGDDFEHWGLHVSPDVDTVMYALAGLSHEERGWGLADETFRALEALRAYGEDGWFAIGDRDLATHMARTLGMARGETLTQATARLCTALGVGDARAAHERRAVPHDDRHARPRAADVPDLVRASPRGAPGDAGLVRGSRRGDARGHRRGRRGGARRHRAVEPLCLGRPYPGACPGLRDAIFARPWSR